MRLLIRACLFGWIFSALGGCSAQDPVGRQGACEGPGCPAAAADAGNGASDPDSGIEPPDAADGADGPALGATFTPIGPDRAWFGAVAATPTAVLVATRVSVRRSRDGGDSWQLLELPELNQVAAMVARGSEIFVVTSENAYHSTDDGDSWQPARIDENAAAQGTALGSHHLSVRGSDVYMLAGGEPYRWNATTNRWNALTRHGSSIGGFDVLASDGSALYANQSSRGGVFRLDLTAPDAQWTRVDGLGEWGYRAFAFVDGAGLASNGATLFRRDESGVWSPLDPALSGVNDLLVEGETIHAATASGLYSSTDRGRTWSRIRSGNFPSGFALATDGSNVFAASDGLWRKSGGPWRAWQRLPLPADEVWRLAATSDGVLSISASGCFVRPDLGVGWETVDVEGVEEASFTRWTPPQPPDKVPSIVVREGVVFLNGPGILTSGNGGRTFVRDPAPGWTGSGSIEFVATIERGLLAGVSYIGGGDLFLSSDGARTWARLSRSPETYLGDATESQGVLLLSGRWSGTYRSADQGLTWKTLALPAEIGDLRGFAIGEDVIFAASSRGGVARSMDQGLTWRRAGLDSLPVSSLAVRKGIVFAGVGSAQRFSGGVYYSSDLGATWNLLDPTFRARVSAIAIHNGALFAGTLDQSTWVARLD